MQGKDIPNVLHLNWPHIDEWKLMETYDQN